MKLRALLTGLILASAVAGCGGSSASSSSGSHAGSAAGVTIYKAVLSGATGHPAGATGAGGDAIVAFHGSTVVCWRFAHLHGFQTATGAHVQLGADHHGKGMIPLTIGTALHHRGCLNVSAAAVMAVEAKPAAYWVEVLSAAFPNGAVRGQL